MAINSQPEKQTAEKPTQGTAGESFPLLLSPRYERPISNLKGRKFCVFWTRLTEIVDVFRHHHSDIDRPLPSHQWSANIYKVLPKMAKRTNNCIIDVSKACKLAPVRFLAFSSPSAGQRLVLSTTDSIAISQNRKILIT